MAKTLLDDVLTRTKNRRPGFSTWFSRLPPEARDELDAVRQAFDASTHQKRAYAAAIIEAAQERGWHTASIQSVIRWLNEKL
jgi:hypothetical protein